MIRSLAILAFLVVLSHSVGFLLPVEGDGCCAQTCPDTEPDNELPEPCLSCTCCPSERPVVPTMARMLAPVSEDRAGFVSDLTIEPPPSDPNDISHVPRIALA